MSYPRPKPVSIGDALADRNELWQSPDGFPPFVHATDRAIDAALRSVPLPDGLLTRLGMLAYCVPDEAADQVDYLGC